MARLADGERAAFTGVFRALWPSILRLCVSMLKNEADATDAAQSAMEKILSRAPEYDRGRPALPWALAIGAWECRTLARQRFRRREGGGEPELVGEVSSAEDALIREDLTRAAVTAMGRLSEAD